MIRFRLTFPGMDRIAVHREAGTDQTVVGEQTVDALPFPLGGKRLGGIDQAGAGIASDGKFDRIKSAFGAIGRVCSKSRPLKSAAITPSFIWFLLNLS